MSILEKNKVDGLAMANEGETLVLLLSDHLPWDEEYEHLIALQDKINAYISFWTSGQYKNLCDASKVVFCSVEIHFLYEPTDNAYKFLDTVNRQIYEEADMGIIVYVDEDGTNG